MDYRIFVTNRVLLVKEIILVLFTALFVRGICGPLTSDDNTNRDVPTTTPSSNEEQTMNIGPCKWVLNRTCPDNDVKFYLFTRNNTMERQNLFIDDSLDKSNISQSFFDPSHPTKIIIHGYNSDMFLDSLIAMKDEYLGRGNYNLIYVDWGVLSGPCYFTAVHNLKHLGACSAQLVKRILDTGTTDIHAIGFSLGAQLTNFMAKNLDTFQLPRITGLDPAMPLFITSSLDEKLDPSDAEYVDVFHTNALVQGKIERCGHVDFYINGGIFQPGCTGNIFACSHQRAPMYFMESIRSIKGFWGWACSSYISYLLGMCPPTNLLVEAGENTSPLTNGLYLVVTANSTPYALGKWTDLPDNKITESFLISEKPLSRKDSFLKEVDEWGKLEGNYNYVKSSSSLHSNGFEKIYIPISENLARK